MPRFRENMTTIISRSELERIRQTAKDTTAIQDAGQTMATKRQQLKKLSMEKVQHWPNTLEASRLKKEMFIKDKLQREELERQEIDRQEAELRKKNRIAAIQRANDLLYEQRDKMKLFRSQVMFCDVLDGRQKQLEENKRKKEASILEAKQDHENIMKKVHELEVIEEEKIRQEKERFELISKTRQEQLLQAKAKKEALEEENRQLGLSMKREAEVRFEEELLQQKEKWEQVKQRNLEFKKANDDLKLIRAELARKEKLAEEQRKEEIKEIENRKIALKDLERKRFDKAQITRQKLIDRALENLKNTINNEEALLQKQINEKNLQYEQIQKTKEAKSADQLRLLKESRDNQIRQRQLAFERQREEESRMIELWKKKYFEDIAEQARKEREMFEFNKALKLSQYNEGLERKKQRAEAHLKQIEEDKFLIEMHQHDDDKFIEHCRSKIEEYRKAGKPTYPLERALEVSEIDLLPARTVAINNVKVKK